MRRVLIVGAIVAMMLSACGGQAATVQPTMFPAAIAQPSSVAAEPASPSAAPSSEPEIATIAGPTAVPAQPQGDAKAALIKAIKAQQSAGPYRSHSVIESSSGTIDLIGEVIMPDRLHLISSFGDTQTELIIIGDKQWIKQGDVWAAEPGGNQLAATLDSYTKSPESLGIAIENVTYIGKDTLDGAETIVYSYDSHIGAGDQLVESSVKIWIDAQTGLPLRQVIVGEAGGIKSTTTQQIEYDAHLTIDAPAS